MSRADAERIAEAVCDAAGLSWRTLPLYDREAAISAVLEVFHDLRVDRETA